MSLREVHLFLTPRSRTLRALRRLLPALQPNLNCDPKNIPPGSVCYTYPGGHSRIFELAAEARGVRYQWGGGGLNYRAVAILNSRLYAVQDSFNGLLVVNFSNPAAPSVLGSVSLPSAPTCITILGRFAWVGCSDGTVCGVNVDNDAAPTVETVDATSSQAWRSIKAVADTLILTGSDGIGLYNVVGDGTGAAIVVPRDDSEELFANGLGQVGISGRRLFAGQLSNGAGAATIYNWRYGGFDCATISAGEFQADHANIADLDGGNAAFSGEISAHSVTIGGGPSQPQSGVGAVANFFDLSGTRLYGGSYDPNGTLAAPVDSFFFRKGGGAGALLYLNTDGATAWTAVL